MMRTEVVESAASVATVAAGIVQDVASLNPTAVIGLPTGRTAIPLYDELARLQNHGALDLSRVLGFNIDELVLSPDDERSFLSFMQRHAYGRTSLNADHCEFPRVQGDLEENCRQYDCAIAAAGGLDLAILGVGADGHVAYNLPGQTQAGCHVVSVPRAVCETLGWPTSSQQLQAVTVGMSTLLGARRVLLIAFGESKSAAIQSLIKGPTDPAWPCSLLRGHANFDLIVDRAAAGSSA